MTGLETAFDIIGIIFMSLMLLIGTIALVAVLVIRSKIVAIHHQIEERVNSVTDWVEKGEAAIGAIKKVTHKSKK